MNPNLNPEELTKLNPKTEKRKNFQAPVSWMKWLQIVGEDMVSPGRPTVVSPIQALSHPFSDGHISNPPAHSAVNTFLSSLTPFRTPTRSPSHTSSHTPFANNSLYTFSPSFSPFLSPIASGKHTPPQTSGLNSEKGDTLDPKMDQGSNLAPSNWNEWLEVLEEDYEKEKKEETGVEKSEVEGENQEEEEQRGEGENNDRESKERREVFEMKMFVAQTECDYR
jgi:hypothetical protein